MLRFILLAFFLASCTTGYFNPGKKRIENNVYTSPKMDFLNSKFQVFVPQSVDDIELTHLKVHEDNNEKQSIVEFGPAALNRSMYGVFVENTPQLTKQFIDHFKKTDPARHLKKLQSMTDAPIKEIVKKDIIFEGKPAQYTVLETKAKDLSNIYVLGAKAKSEYEKIILNGVTFIGYLTIFNEGSSIVNLSFRIQQDSEENPIEKLIWTEQFKEEILQMKEPITARFFRSFKFIPATEAKLGLLNNF